MGRRSRRKVDAVIGVALVLGLIGSEMRPDGAIVGGRSPAALERSDTEILASEAGAVDPSLIEELSRIKGLDESVLGNDKGGVILPVVPMPSPKTAVRPDHCYSSFLGKEIKQEPGFAWHLPQDMHPDSFYLDHYPVTEVQYMPSGYDERIGFANRQSDIQGELADLIAAVQQPSSGEQSPFSLEPVQDPQELLNEILAESGQLAFDGAQTPLSPKMAVDEQLPFLDPSQDIFRWMEQGSFETPESSSSSHTSDIFGLSDSCEDYIHAHTKNLPAAETDRTIDELLFALENEETPSDDIPTMKTQLPTQLLKQARKRKSGAVSWSSGASCASSSSKSNLDPTASDFHNHTYDDGSARRAKAKFAKIRSSSDDNSGGARCRDINEFAALAVPFDYERVVTAEPAAFTSMVNDHALNDEQRALMRAARRRAKNRNAARQCRQRRVDEVEELADEVETLEEERNQVVSEMNAIDDEIAAQRNANERLRTFIIETYTEMRPPTLSDAEYRLQANPRNGSFSLVEQRGIKA